MHGNLGLHVQQAVRTQLVHQPAQGDPFDLDELANVQRTLDLLQVTRQVDVHHLVGKANGRMNAREVRPAPGTVARLFHQLTLGGLQAGFARILLAGRDLHVDPPRAITELALDQDASIGVDGHHGGRPGVHDELARVGGAIGHAGHVLADLQEAPLVDHLARYGTFGQ